MSEAEAQIKITAQNLADAALNKVTSDIRGMVAKSVPQVRKIATDGFKYLDRTVDGTVRGLLNLKTAAVAALTGWGLQRLAGDFISTGASMDNLRISLDTITKGQGDEWFTKLNEWAMNMPLNTEKAIQSFTMMRAMGLQPTIDDMTTLVDTSAAIGGSDMEGTLEGIARALGQIQAKGKVSTEELMQLGERGVPYVEILKEKLGLTAAQVADIAKQGIGAEKVIAALVEGMGDRFGGMADKMNKKLTGLWEATKAYYKDFQRMVMDSNVTKALESILTSVNDKITELRKSGDLSKIAQETGADVIDVIAEIIHHAGQIPNAFYATKKAVYEIVAGLHAVEHSITQIAGLAALFVAGQTTQEKIAEEQKRLEELQGKKAQAQKNKEGWRGAILGEDVYQREIDRYNAAINEVKQRKIELSQVAGTTLSDILVDTVSGSLDVMQQWGQGYRMAADEMDRASEKTDRFAASARNKANELRGMANATRKSSQEATRTVTEVVKTFERMYGVWVPVIKQMQVPVKVVVDEAGKKSLEGVTQVIEKVGEQYVSVEKKIKVPLKVSVNETTTKTVEKVTQTIEKIGDKYVSVNKIIQEPITVKVDDKASKPLDNVTTNANAATEALKKTTEAAGSAAKTASTQPLKITAVDGVTKVISNIETKFAAMRKRVETPIKISGTATLKGSSEKLFTEKLDELGNHVTRFANQVNTTAANISVGVNGGAAADFESLIQTQIQRVVNATTVSATVAGERGTASRVFQQIYTGQKRGAIAGLDELYKQLDRYEKRFSPSSESPLSTTSTASGGNVTVNITVYAQGSDSKSSIEQLDWDGIARRKVIPAFRRAGIKMS